MGEHTRKLLEKKCIGTNKRFPYLQYLHSSYLFEICLEIKIIQTRRNWKRVYTNIIPEEGVNSYKHKLYVFCS